MENLVNIYENGRLSAIKRNDLNMWIIYDDNGPVTLKYGSGTFHYVTNPQGDVVAIVGNQGQKLVEYTYDAWGKVTSITGDYAYNLGVHNPILYRGYIYDHETGLYYCQSRYYDPETGRFLNADAFASTGQGLLGNNMFAYCGNNPVNYEDSSGTYHRSLDSGIRSVSYEAPGTKGTALAQYMQGTSPYGKLNVNITGEQVWTAARYVLKTGASAGFGMVFPVAKGVATFIGALSAYDKCRCAGLSSGTSLFTTSAYVIMSIFEVPVHTTNQRLWADTGVSSLSDAAVNIGIAIFMPAPSEAAQNRVQHMAQKSGFVAVSGGMRYTYFTNDWGDGVSVRP